MRSVLKMIKNMTTKSEDALEEQMITSKNKVSRKGKISEVTKKWVWNCYGKSILLYDSKYWKIRLHRKRKLAAKLKCYYRNMMRIPWTIYLINEEVLRKTETKSALVQKQLKFLGCIMRKESMENFTHMKY